MELQLAIDLLNKEEAAELAKKVEEYVDIVEIGTPIVINEGLPAVQHLNENISNAKVLADLKIIDAADYEVSQAVKFGADVVTIPGVTEDASIKDVVAEDPDLVIVGGGIANADDSVEDAKQCRDAIECK
ncbi:orotidine 5'-phosphate decarboxylase [Staphylococcus epidermidis]|uniref:orotidine 5'-phosphate decarboxylase / HUMPS family protein n=1 Tax=Staphylococcus epidermidis TaxID=1282 RepID=UPI0034DCD285|nr:orotidine 5'-phosphate decarboxylase [Staphylococcus epidermidis]MCG1463378.1 orotidine 5'-phosphate decarboxylase [Staphylococcus epidermidis]MCG1479233.1 orotidine 5'-phosphate decarboxylase [Staphylococcus epidermidis]